MKSTTTKAYKNIDFLTSPEARSIRVLCELTEPAVRLRKYNIEHSIVFFGSARAKPKKIAEKNFSKTEKVFKRSPKSAKAKLAFEQAKADLYMSKYYEQAAELSFKLAKWIKGAAEKHNSSLVICTGGGSGIMEAVNFGANKAGGKSLGFNISLPFEQKVNNYVTDNLRFEFHYFFIRKFWFAYLAKALVIFPGGFGTLDEMMEVLTLIQTNKMGSKIPIIIFGTEYWNEVINFKNLAKFNTIDYEDLKLINFFDDVDKAFDFLKENLNSEIKNKWQKNKC